MTGSRARRLGRCSAYSFQYPRPPGGGLAALDAARDAGNRWIFPELADEGLAPWHGVRLVCVTGAEAPTHGVDVTGDPLERGSASLAAHGEYTKAWGAGF